MPIILEDGNIVCGTEVSFLSRDEISYPQLMRLHLDFDFRVLSLSNPAHPNESLKGDAVKNNPVKDSPTSANPVHHSAITSDHSPPSKKRQTPRYLVTFNTHQREDVPTITPVFTSLPELESYANDNIVDILNKLVVDTQED